MMLKIFTPLIIKILIPFAQLFSVGFVVLSCVSLYQIIYGTLRSNNFGDSSHYVAYGASFLIFGGVAFFSINLLIDSLEKNKNISVVDHFRQNIFLYLLLFWTTSPSLEKYIKHENAQAVSNGGAFGIPYIIFYSIFVNAIFLYIRHKWPRITARFISLKALAFFAFLTLMIIVLSGLPFNSQKKRLLQNPGMNNPVDIPPSLVNSTPHPVPAI